MTKMVSICCGRSECGGECGNEWQGMRPAPLPRASDAFAQAWQTGTPPVEKGNHHEFIVAVRRAQSSPPGKVFVFSANFANKYGEDENESMNDRDGEPFVADGWYHEAVDSCGEFDYVFQPVPSEGDEVVGWQQLPKWETAGPVSDATGVVKTGEAT